MKKRRNHSQIQIKILIITVEKISFRNKTHVKNVSTNPIATIFFNLAENTFMSAYCKKYFIALDSPLLLKNDGIKKPNTLSIIDINVTMASNIPSKLLLSCINGNFFL